MNEPACGTSCELSVPALSQTLTSWTSEKFRAVDRPRKGLRRALDPSAAPVREPVAWRDRCILSYSGRDCRHLFSKAMQCIILNRVCQRFSEATFGELAWPTGK